MNILVAILGFVLAIGVLVTVHEFGHYLVARLCGVRVLRFSIGFGRPLIRRRMGADNTEYVLGAIPLGGYVKMLDEREGEVPAGENHRCFNRQSIPRRAAIVTAGPAFNFLFAVLAYWMIFVVGIPGIKPVIGEVGSDSPAAEAGLMAEDELLAVNDQAVSTWQGANIELLEGLLRDEPIRIRFQRGDEQADTELRLASAERRALTEPGALLEGLGLQPWFVALPAVIGELSEDGVARSAGLEAGDRVLAVDGETVENWRQFREAVAARPGQAMVLRLEREGVARSLTVSPEAVDTENGVEGRIGAAPRVPEELLARMRSLERHGPVAALGQGLSRTWEMSSLTVRMLWRMLNGDVSVRNISGPINIAHYAGITVSSGLVSFLGFLAIVSISLGIVNLLPVPVLDGGHLVYLGIESVTGKPVSERVLAIGQTIGLMMIAGLVSFALYNDLMRLLG